MIFLTLYKITGCSACSISVVVRYELRVLFRRMLFRYVAVRESSGLRCLWSTFRVLFYVSPIMYHSLLGVFSYDPKSDNFYPTLSHSVSVWSFSYKPLRCLYCVNFNYYQLRYQYTACIKKLFIPHSASYK